MPNRIPFHQPAHVNAPGRIHELGRHRLSAHRRGYGRKWARYRLWYLMQPDHAVCRICRRKSATEVDHVVPIDGPLDPLFWDPGNHQPACHGCHSRKTASEDGGFGRKRG